MGFGHLISTMYLEPVKSICNLNAVFQCGNPVFGKYEEVKNDGYGINYAFKKRVQFPEALKRSKSRLGNSVLFTIARASSSK